jgi:hypothetical protein
MLTGGEGHESVVMMLWTGRLLAHVRLENDMLRARLTLAVAVSGCASTVGVRALSAATHVDDVNWCLEKRVVGKLLVRLIEVV